MEDSSDLRRCLLDALVRIQMDPAVDGFHEAFRMLERQLSGAEPDIARELNKTRAVVIARREQRFRAERDRAKGAPES